ncbi:hypothetical protein ACFYZI_33155 [Streptomyces griseorubiginosus]|uniref:hypothetical protein n=1 Tax=Streptomyces griseorubiginosus TaxID=67304 RepID=UPI0036BECF56
MPGAEPGRRGPYGERQTSAQPDDVGRGIRFRRHPVRAGEPGEELTGAGGAQHVQAQQPRLLEAGQGRPTADELGAAVARARQQGSHLPFAGRVVEDIQRPPAGQQGAEGGGQFGQYDRRPHGPGAQCAQESREHLGRSTVRAGSPPPRSA